MLEGYIYIETTLSRKKELEPIVIYQDESYVASYNIWVQMGGDQPDSFNEIGRTSRFEFTYK